MAGFTSPRATDEQSELAGAGWPSSVADRALLTPAAFEGTDPFDAAKTADASQPSDERTPLLSGSTSAPAPYDPSKDRRPWYRRPSPWCFLMAAATGSTMAPAIELINLLVCRSIYGDRAPSPQMSVFGQSHDLGPGALDPTSCRRDPQVQRALAAFLLALSLIRGVGGALTTSYWTLLSDRIGRKTVLALALIGFWCSDLAFITVARNYKTLSYQYILVGSVVEGVFGGYATIQAAFGAYASDCTPTGSRAKIFSILMGTLFAGVSLGPSLGAAIVALTGSPLAPMYTSATMTFINILSIVVILPESVTSERKAKAREAWQELKAKAKDSSGGIGERIKGWFSFLQPLTFLFPKRHATINAEQMTEEEDDRAALLHGRVDGQRNWTLTLVAIAYAFYVSFYGVMTVKLQYSQLQFGWGPKENAFILTLVGVCRVIWLVGLLPLAIRYLKRQSPVHQTSDNWNVKAHSLERLNKKSRLLYDAHFDITLAKLSFVVYFSAFAIFIFSTGEKAFIVATALMAAGSGAGPALQSIAISLCNASDNGKVTGGLSVVQSISSSTLGPILYATVFRQTLEIWPQAIFALAAFSMFAAFTTLSLVKLPSRSAHTSRSVTDLRRRSGMDLSEEVRGRQALARANGRFDNDSAISTN